MIISRYINPKIKVFICYYIVPIKRTFEEKMSLFKEINTENKLRITLTFFAMSTLKEDEADFGLGITSLLNRIISYYSPEADASISLKLKSYEATVTNALHQDAESVIKRLMDAEEKELANTIPVYSERPESIVFRLSNANVFALTEDPTSSEEMYYKGIKSYIEAVVEEFTRLPFLERERYYCSEILNVLELAMKTESAAFIFHTYGKKYLMRVFEITTDSLSTHSYVIGRLIDPKNKRMDGRIYTFRLSRIEKVVLKSQISGSFSDEEKQKTALAVSKAGAQFLGDRISKVVVEFTDDGLKQYASQMHLRPHATKISKDGHTYEFECTSTQALFYFRRLGANAKIIKPASLKKEMEKWFLDAYEHYHDAMP